VTWVRARHRSVCGPITVHWRQDGGRFQLDLQVPLNLRASVRVPTSGPGGVRESGSQLAAGVGLRTIRSEPGAVVIQVGREGIPLKRENNGVSRRAELPAFA
jgi:hypothetical protein